MAREQLNVQVLGPLYFGTRHVNLKPRRRITTPADLAGMKLRMPPGETWQFLGEALGANPTPVAFAELYTALQSGAVDGQDNPLPTSRTMRFYEVTTQFVLTSHLVAYDLLSVSARRGTALTPAQRTAMQAAADKAIDETRAALAQEQEMVDFFKQGLEVYTPNLDAFRAEAQRRYLDQSQSWPAGILDRINAVGDRNCSPIGRPPEPTAAGAPRYRARSRSCAWLRRRAEDVSPRCWSRCSSPSWSRSSCATCFNAPVGWTDEVDSSPGSGASCGARGWCCARRRRSASTSSMRGGAGARRVFDVVTGSVVVAVSPGRCRRCSTTSPS